MYQPKSVVTHFEGVSNGTELDSGLKKYQVENGKKFKEKWATELQSQYESGQVPFCARERNHGKKIILIIKLLKLIKQIHIQILKINQSRIIMIIVIS